ncbi:MAG: tetratricopeptide repeat protein [Lachnospiraceae bacterium]|nr:tetratricopeptide repeat protein [Lachnospiraceae bacterium]
MSASCGGKKKTGIFFLCFVLCTALLACANGPTGAEAVRRAEEEIAALRYDLALEEAGKAIDAGENLRDAYRLQGIAHFKRAEYEEAKESFVAALRESSGIVTAMDYDCNLYLAASMRETGDYAGAIAIYDHILALRSDDMDALFDRGVCCLYLDDITAATEAFDRAIARTPRDFDLRVRIFLAYEAAGYTETGRAILNEALASYGAAMSDYEKGRYAYYLGNNGEAQSCLDRALSAARGAEREPIVRMLGLTGENQGDYGYAVRVYSDFIAQDQTSAEIYNRRGVCLMRQGEYTAAIADFEAGIALADASVQQTLLRNEISAYEYAGNFQSAKRLMSEYIRMYPDDADAQREWEFLSTR